MLGATGGAIAAGVLTALPLVSRGAGQTWPLLLVGNAFVAAALGMLALLGHMLSLLRLGPWARTSEGALAAIALGVGFIAAGGPLAVAHVPQAGGALGCMSLGIGGPLLGAVVGRLLLSRAMRRGWVARFEHDRHCHGCGHDLSGAATDRCPECGAPASDSVSTSMELAKRMKER